MPGTLTLTDLRFRFRGQSADLFQVDAFTLTSGHTLGIRGASGAGKTTLLHCLAGIEPVSNGSIQWGDQAISTLHAGALTQWRQRHLGLVFQDFHLIEGLSALDNVLLPASFSSWRASAELKTRAQHLLERVSLSSPDRRAELLSRGERQRVAVARALLFKPAIVLADEPTASLDPDNRHVISTLLLDLVREHGATLVVVSHEHDLLSRLDHLVELRDGSLQAMEKTDV